MSLRVYVAGASVDVATVEWQIEKLRTRDIVITHDWTTAVKAHGVGNDASLSLGERRRHALEDLAGVQSADVVWLVVPSAGASRGCWLEIGYAIGEGVPFIASGDDARSIFTSLAIAHFETHDAAAAYLVAEAAERGR